MKGEKGKNSQSREITPIRGKTNDFGHADYLFEDLI